MTADHVLARLDAGQRKVFAEEFLGVYLRSSLGALPKTEIDLLVFRLLYDAGAFREDGSQRETSHYDIARLLNVTPAQVRGLMLRKQLRDPAQTEDALRRRLSECLSQTKFLKGDEKVVFGVEDPLLQAYIVERMKRLKETPDFSFNREILQISKASFIELVVSLLDADQKKVVERALGKAGFSAQGFRGLLEEALRQAGKKLAGKAGEEAVKLLGPALQSLFEGSVDLISSKWAPLQD